MPRFTEIPYQPDATRTFANFRDLPRPVLLDSALPASGGGRFDIVAADPTSTLTTTGSETVIETRNGATIRSSDDPLSLLRDALDGPAAEPSPDVPFKGGAIGCFGYDLGRRWEHVDGSAVDDIGLPAMAVGVYDWAVVTDHAARRSWVAGEGRDPRTLAGWNEIVRRATADAGVRRPDSFEVESRVRPNMSRAEYAAAFDRIKAHIRLGNCYQANLTQRFEASVRGDSWQAYLALRAANPAPFCAYLEWPGFQVLSSSPELFLRVVDGRVETKPIKGTRRRSADIDEDRRLAGELRQSVKDRAENVMIVDLLRNDIGKVCVPGSVRAERLFDVESFANVHHLVSTVTGTLGAGRHSLDLLRACFPGGSITGAPKLAAMRIIDDVEPHRRSVYCGSIGYVGFDGRMDTNVAIRTLLRRGDTMYAWAGGGIVADSSVDGEYQESLDKAAAMLSILDPVRSAANG